MKSSAFHKSLINNHQYSWSLNTFVIGIVRSVMTVVVGPKKAIVKCKMLSLDESSVKLNKVHPIVISSRPQTVYPAQSITLLMVCIAEGQKTI